MSAFSELDKQVAKTIADGLKACLTEAQSLERAGLLLTPQRKLSIASTALLDVARLLEETKMGDIMPQGVPLTPNDVKRCVALWIEQIVEDNKEN
jgi:hypothetical protein